MLGTPSLCQEFERASFEVTWEEPETVVVGFDMTLTYERLCRAAYWIAQGRPFLATHPDLVCPTDGPRFSADCGSICACLPRRQAVVRMRFSASPPRRFCWTSPGAWGSFPEQMVMVGRPDLHGHADGPRGRRSIGAGVDRGSDRGTGAAHARTSRLHRRRYWGVRSCWKMRERRRWRKPARHG